ncbi:MAG: DNA polymerase III subunit gamma/tau [Phycisphaerae bacterium]|nr:DNA polymerase III subunit gamma/tau [Phycisphaerae bacterium]
MSDYLVLARKYRSLTFDEVVGQEPIAQTLVNAIQTSRVHHAYLFTGTRGVGKTTMARILAKALNCLKSDGPTVSPCNECEACLAIGRGEDIDVVEIDGASNRGIDEMRELRANAIFRPARCRYKIYYIDEVHQITRDAFNSLLKTLEEPPSHVKFIFATTEPEKIPATILSRCQRFDFRNISTARIAEHLADLCQRENVKADDEALYRVARAAAGSMRDGLSLLDQLLAGGGNVTDAEVIRVLGTPPDERMVSIIKAIVDGNSAAALDELAAVLDSGVALSSVVSALGEIYRNMMIAATCGGDSELIELPESQRKDVAELAGRFSLPVLVQAVGITQTVGRNIRGSSVGRALVEAALVRLAEADKFVDPASLIERLEQLSSGGALPAGQKKNFLAEPPAYQPSQAQPQPQTYQPAQPARVNPSPAAQTAQPRPAGAAPVASSSPEPAEPEQPAAKPPRQLSTKERDEVQNDPAVREVMTLFGGDLVGIHRDQPDGADEIVEESDE